MNDELDAQAAELLAETERDAVRRQVIEQNVGANSSVTMRVSDMERLVDREMERRQATLEDATSMVTIISDEGITHTPIPEQQESDLAERDLEAELAEFEAELNSVKPLPTDDDILNQVTVALEAIWPGNWDVQLIDDIYSIIIKFPEVTVTNSKRMETHIKDLYVKLQFRQADWVCASRMAGRRGVFTYPQWKSSYSHSHLPRSKGSGWADFCLGSSEMSAIQAEWRMDGHQFDIIEFELWMYQIDAYVRWESLGGGPHIRMSSISATGRETHLYDGHMKTCLHILSKIAHKDNLGFPLDYDKVAKKFTVSQGLISNWILKHRDKLDTFDNVVVPNRWHLEEMWVKFDGHKFIYGNPDWRAINNSITEYNANTSDEESYKFMFQGKEVRPLILPYDAPDEDNLQVVPHPQLTKYISTHLEQKTNNYYIKNYGK